jgi:hypothetical protein
MSKTIVFNSGIPTAPDVKRLRDSFPELKQGDMVPYETISRLINVAHRTSRWVSVVLAWRRELYRDSNLILRAVANTGFEVLDDSERVHFAGAKYKQGLKRVIRAADIASKTERSTLSKEELKACDHLVSVGASIRLAAATAAKQLRYPDPEKK